MTLEKPTASFSSSCWGGKVEGKDIRYGGKLVCKALQNATYLNFPTLSTLSQNDEHFHVASILNPNSPALSPVSAAPSSSFPLHLPW